MAWYDDLFLGASLPGVLIGVGVVLVAPVLLPAVGAAARPLAKALIGAGLAVTDAFQEAAAAVGEGLSDLTAEVRYEQAGAPQTPEPHPITGPEA
jgi:hypothetical protein